MFRPVEKALDKSFLPAILKGAIAKVPLQGITHLPAK